MAAEDKDKTPATPENKADLPVITTKEAGSSAERHCCVSLYGSSFVRWS